MAYLLELGIGLEVHGSSRVSIHFHLFSLCTVNVLHVAHLLGVIIIINIQ